MNNSTKKLSITQQYEIISINCVVNDLFRNFVYGCARESLDDEAAIAFVGALDLTACIQYANEYIKKNNTTLNISDEISELNEITNRLCLPLKQEKEVSKQDYIDFSKLNNNLTTKLCNFGNGPFIGYSMKQILAELGGKNGK